MSIFLSRNMMDDEMLPRTAPQQQASVLQAQPSATSEFGKEVAPDIASKALETGVGAAATAALGPLGFLAGPALTAGIKSFFQQGTPMVPQMNYARIP